MQLEELCELAMRMALKEVIASADPQRDLISKTEAKKRYGKFFDDMVERGLIKCSPYHKGKLFYSHARLQELWLVARMGKADIDKLEKLYK